jgi:WD40 repeat protein
METVSQKTFKGRHNGKVQSLAWNLDGTLLASGSIDSNALLWTLQEGQDLLPVLALRGHTEAVQSVCKYSHKEPTPNVS